MAFAETTTVPVEKTRAEIETLLKKKGATKIGYMADSNQAVIMFECSKRQVRFELPMPSIADKSIRCDGRGYVRSDKSKMDALAQEERRRWRVLLLTIKSRFEFIDTGLSTFDAEFITNIVVPTPNGAMPIGQFMLPQIERAYANGTPVPFLLGEGARNAG